MFLFLSRGAAVPLGPSPPHCYGLEITLGHSSHSIELLRTSDRPVAETSTSENTTVHAAGGIRIRNLSKEEATDPSLRKRGHRDRR
jgi:hypothetical protein